MVAVVSAAAAVIVIKAMTTAASVIRSVRISYYLLEEHKRA